MTPRRYAVLMALCVLVIGLASNVAVWTAGAGLRADFTSDRRFTLSPPVRTLLAELSEPIELTLYVSEDIGRADPALARHAAQVRQMLATFAAASDGRIRVRERVAARFSVAEDEAIAAGLRPLRPGVSASTFLGLEAVNAVNQRAVAPTLAPEEAANLEAALARLILTLEDEAQAQVALVTTLGEESAPVRALAGAAQILPLSPGFSAIPATADMLALIHPWSLSAVEAGALEAFLARGGQVIVAVDPAYRPAVADVADPYAALGALAPARSELPAAFEALGLRLSRGALSPAEGWPPVVGLRSVGADPVAAGADGGLAAAAPGALLVAARPSGVIAPTLRASVTAFEIAAADALARERPTLTPPETTDGDGALAAARVKDAAGGEALVIADVDVLATAAGARLLAQAVADFGPEDPLAALPARTGYARSLTGVTRAREQATAQAERARAAIQAELDVVEAELAAAEARAAVAADDFAELAALRERSLKVRAELRASDQAFLTELRGLDRAVTWINLFAGPLLVGGFGAAAFLVRRKRMMGEAP